MFLIAGVMLVITGSLYVLFGSASLQSWNTPGQRKRNCGAEESEVETSAQIAPLLQDVDMLNNKKNLPSIDTVDAVCNLQRNLNK